MSNIFIDIAAEFVGRKAFKEAETSTEKLTKSVKSLGRTLGVTLSTAAVLSYAKASVSAAANDARAQRELALALENVGLGRDSASAEGYIQRLQTEFGILDDQLRPAYQRLAVATRDSAETQKLLNLSLDISAGTGKDLNAVTSALTKAYLGSNTALSRLGVGISKADLKTKSFDDIANQLSFTFAGAAKESADTFAGSIGKLSVATNNAKEIIGTSLIGALTSLSKDNSMKNFAADIENAAKSMANFIDSVVYLKDQISSIPGAGLVKSGLGLVTNILGRFSPQRAAELLKQIKGFQGMGNVSMTGGSNQDLQKSDALAKKQMAVAKQSLAVNKDALKLAKAQAIFNLQKIQIEAALKGKISEEDKARLKLMQAIEDQNITMIDKYTAALDAAQKKTKELQDVLNTLKMPKLSADITSSVLSPELFAALSARANQTVNTSSLAGIAAASASPATAPQINVTVNGAMDPVAVANQIQETLTSAANRVGKYINLGSGRKDQMYVL